MDFLQSNLSSSLFIAVLYPVDLIFTRHHPSHHPHHHLLHPRTKKISSSEFKMYCWLIKGVLIECSELGTPFTKCTQTHTHTHTHTHTRPCLHTQKHTCNHSDSTGYTKDVALGEFHANQKWRERRVPILQVKWDF